MKEPLYKTYLTSIFTLPYSLIMMPYVKRKQIDSKLFFGVCIDFKKEENLTLELLNELSINRIVLQIKLLEMDKLDELKSFILKNKDRNIILKIIQDRKNIEDMKLLKENLTIIFKELQEYVNIFEIGTGINNNKSGFFTINEYNNFYKTAYKLKLSDFKDITLIGGGVIGFKYPLISRILFNFYKFRYDGLSLLLDIDSNKNPESTQFGFSISDKIAWLSTMIWLSPKTKHSLHITEMNYLDLNKKDKTNYINFMLRSYLLTFASQQVDSLSWNQLIAPIYGIIDSENSLKKDLMFYSYKYMIKILSHAQFLRLDIKRDYYILQFLVDDKLLQIHWSLIDTTLNNEEFFDVFSKDGERVKDEVLQIGASPTYIFVKDAE